MSANPVTVNALRLAKRLDTLAARSDVSPSQKALLRALAAGNDQMRLDPQDPTTSALLANLRRHGERRSLLYVVR